MNYQGRVIEYNKMIQQIWALEDPSMILNLKVHIQHLRAKLKKCGATVNIINKREVGYYLGI